MRNIGLCCSRRRIPKNYRGDQTIRKKYIYFILTGVAVLGHSVMYGVVGAIFTKIPEEYQWIATLFLPVYREVAAWMFLKLIYNATDSHDTDIAQLLVQHFIGVKHTLFLTIALGTVATQASTYIVIGQDFLINIYLCMRSIYMLKYKKNEASVDQAHKNIQELVLNERIEFATPLSYVVCFLMAYYGPNAEIMGNIKFSSWHYGDVASVGKFLSVLSLLFAVDFASGFVSAILLWIFCNINLIKILLELQRDLWIMMAVQESFAMVSVTHISLYLNVIWSTLFYFY